MAFRIAVIGGDGIGPEVIEQAIRVADAGPSVVQFLDRARDQRRGSRAGQPLEEALVHHLDVGVEARQAQRGACAIDERRDPADAAHATQGPLVHDERRRRPERDHVREAVVLGAEGRLRAREARHAAVQAVEDHRAEDCDRRPVEVAIDRRDDRAPRRAVHYNASGVRCQGARVRTGPNAQDGRDREGETDPANPVDPVNNPQAERTRWLEDKMDRMDGITGSSGQPNGRGIL